MNKDTVTILILCTGNSCRSQMAAGILRSLDPDLQVLSAGTRPASRVHPLAVRVMRETGIDLSGARPRDVETLLERSFDYVVTVCDNAKDMCPLFSGEVRHRMHIGFEDPAEAEGTEAEILALFRRVRDEIRDEFNRFYREKIMKHYSDGLP